MPSAMDDAMRRVLDALDKSKYRDNTIICLWSDVGTTLFGTTAVPYSDANATTFPRCFYQMRTP